MRITTKFIGSSALLITLTAILSGSGYLIKQHSERRLSQVYTQTQTVVTDVVQLKVALQDQITALNRLSVLLGNSEEQRNYSQARSQFITALDELEALVPEEDGLAHVRLDGIRRQHQYLERLAEQLAEGDRTEIDAREITRSLRLFESSTDPYVQALLDDASGKALHYRDQQISNRSRAALLDAASFSTVILLLITQFYGLLRPVMRSLRMLEAGVDSINGKTPVPIDLQARDAGDEIQALALAFNGMNERLQASYQELENRVNERTASLNRSNTALLQEIDERTKTEAQLSQTLKQLQDTQIQLLQTAKMSSLSKLVAGVAHEINNPVSFIKGNLEPAEDYMDSMLQVITQYQAEYPEASAELQRTVENAELSFIQSDFPQLLASIHNGADRITTIVRSLQTFSHLDESETKAIDLHEGLDSALLILSSQLKATPQRAEITVAKRYGKLPKVYCYPSQLNQAFMNMFTNAIDAINSAVSTELEPTITVTTEVQESCVRVAIADNGIGMTAAEVDQVFEPFFTTKTVGEGVGLGLSMSYQIVKNNHQGSLVCSSTPEQGTTFTMTIPLSLKIQHNSPLTSEEAEEADLLEKQIFRLFEDLGSASERRKL